MSRISRWLAMSGADRALLSRAWFMLIVTRASLRVVRLDSLRRTLPGLAGRAWRRRGGGADAAARAAWAVDAAAGYVPGSTCLVRALVVSALLADHSDAQMRIGVRRDGAGAFSAHAWVEIGGLIVYGEVPEHYTPMEALPGEGRAPTA